MNLRLGVLCAGVAAAWVGLGISACADGAPPPGYEQLGGNAGEGGADSTTTGSTVTHATSTGSSPTSTSTTTTSTTTTTTTTTSTGTGGLMCDQEPSEDNDTESNAAELPAQSDCSDGASFAGVLEGVMDTDWFKYAGSDDFGIGCSTDPTRSVSSSAAVRFCKYIQCMDDSVPDFTCPDGADSATSPDGRPGCCSATGFTIDYVCGSSSLNDDSAWVYMSLKTTTNACVTYSVDYDF